MIVFRAGCNSPLAVKEAVTSQVRDPRERLTRWDSGTNGQSPDGRRRVTLLEVVSRLEDSVFRRFKLSLGGIFYVERS